ncbi:apolipoprotein F [Eleutherodactylus coqui]|uniref:apolipoprotein F n=1 Tax=Eleutherodactylus coqui TaxID=57060 RepID=UPI0034626867
MALLWRCVIFCLFHPLLYGKPHNIEDLIQNDTGATEKSPLQTISVKDFSWAKGNQTCSQLLKDSKEFLGLLPPSSSWLFRPALALGLLEVGCLTEQDDFFWDLIRDEVESQMFNIMAKQLNGSIHQTTANPHNSQQYMGKLDLLKFNLESLSMNAPSHHKHCSGIQHEEQNVLMKGLILGLHSSLQDAKDHCDELGSVCAGVSSDTLGKFIIVARNGGYIIPHAGSKLWLHHCIGGHLRRRSTDPECHGEQELHIYNVMKKIPIVNGYYNAGSAIYYATQGCTAHAEDRAIEASVDIGYDALFAATGGVSLVISTGVGIAVKPVLKDGIKSAINYFKALFSS